MFAEPEARHELNDTRRTGGRFNRARENGQQRGLDETPDDVRFARFLERLACNRRIAAGLGRRAFELRDFAHGLASYELKSRLDLDMSRVAETENESTGRSQQGHQGEQGCDANRHVQAPGVHFRRTVS